MLVGRRDQLHEKVHFNVDSIFYRLIPFDITCSSFIKIYRVSTVSERCLVRGYILVEASTRHQAPKKTNKVTPGMKRSHDDISSPGNDDLPGEKTLENKSGNGVVKAEPTAPVSGGQSTAPAVGGARETNSSTASSIRRKCPYLDTINRNVLDFDFEKVWR